MAFEGIPVMLMANQAGGGFQGIPVMVVNAGDLQSAEWGKITGTLSAQADLEAALNALLAPADVVGDAPVNVTNTSGVLHVKLTSGSDGQAIVTLNGTPTWGNQTASAVGAIATNMQGVANGVATLGADAKVPAAQLPAPLFGDTSARPATPPIGTMFFDTTLGKPIWFKSPGWVDATGAAAA